MNKKIWIILGLIILIPTAKGEPGCISYGYFENDGIEHRSLLTNGGYHFGNKLIVETNCEIDIYISNELFTNTNLTTEIFLQNGFHDIRFEGDNFTRNFSNVFVQGGNFLENSVYLNETIYTDDKILLTAEELSSKSVTVAFLNSLILFVLVTTVLWRGINFYIDRSYFEEVSA